MMRPPETEFFLQWGTRKRLRCVRIRSSSSPPHLLSHFSSDSSDPSSTTRIRRKISSRFHSATNQDKQAPCRLTRNQETGAVLRSDSRRGSPEKEERSYTTRGSVSSFAGMMNMEENGKVHQSDGHGHGVAGVGVGEEHANRNHQSHNRGCGVAWPKLYVALSSKEKEEDFLAMKGCKLPQRPKKRAKVIQRTILLVSPGTWLSDMTQERYEVREKKTSKRKPRGLKAMGNVDSDSD